uniref:tRNA (32-2'-O)-methyltransferase regulator THADA n=1 Tax=Globodera rostochiensis TaxID=31243 RepID=A0A914HUU7_GLORO
MSTDCCHFKTSQSLQEILFSQSKPEWLLPCCGQHGGFLSDHCVSLLVQEAICWATDAPRVLRCSTVLTRISSILIEFCSSLSNSTQSLFLSHCLRFLDFPYAESIGYQCAALLMNLVALHGTNCVHCLTIDKGCEWLLSVGHSLCGAHTELFSKIRIKALHSLLHCSAVEASLSLRDRLMTEPFVARLYAQIGHAPLSIQISKVIVDDCSVAVRLNRPNTLTFHMDWIKKQLLATDVSVRQAIEQKLLPALLKSPESRRWFRLEFHSFASLPRDSAHSPRALCTLLRLAIDRIGNEEGNCDFGWEDFVSAAEFSDEQNGGGGISADFMEKALFDGPSTDSETQLSALSLICSHPKGARPVSARECQIVRQFVAKSFGEPSPSVRQHILTQIAKLFSRVSEHSKSLQKINDVLNLTKYRQFVHDIEQLALEHLPDQSTLLIYEIEKDEETANGESDGELGFSCRVFALMLISLIHSAQLCDLSFAPFEWKALIASLDDQFELCQDTALKLIDQIFPSPLQKGISFDFTVFLENTKKDLLFANPHSPRHQLAVEYRLRFLLPRLSDNVRRAFFDALIKLGANVCEQAANVNGFDEENPNLIRLVQICPQLHAILSAILASMPHIFRDDNATNIERKFLRHFYTPSFRCAIAPLNFRTVQLLSKTCWRSHKSISHIFSRLIKWMPSPNSLSTEQMIKIGEYFWLQLTECRHCGAFEAAADAFRVICIRFWAFSSASDQFPCSPAKWLRQIVDALTGKISARHLCPSRRSAGLPHLVNALLCSEPPLSPDRRKFANFDHTVSALLDCRRSEDRQLEFHCVNVLRLLFSQSLLEERIFPYVEEAFQLSLNGCADEFWPVRNAHVQLFAVLIERIFGTPPTQQRSLHIQLRCKMSAHEFFTRYPSLYHSLGNCLRKLRLAVLRSFECPLGVVHHFAAFPALILLTHLRPAAHELGQTHSLRPFFPDLIQLLFALPARALREIASAALCSMATFTELQQIFDCIYEIGLAVHQRSSKNVSNLATDSISIFLDHIVELNVTILTSTDQFRKLREITRTFRSNRSGTIGHIQKMIYDAC